MNEGLHRVVRAPRRAFRRSSEHVSKFICCSSTRMPGGSVVSREFSEEFGRCLVIEASQAGAIVVGDEGVQVGVAFAMVEKAAVVGGAVLRHAAEMLAEAAVE